MCVRRISGTTKRSGRHREKPLFNSLMGVAVIIFMHKNLIPISVIRPYAGDTMTSS